MMSSSQGMMSGWKMSTGMMAFVVIWALAGLSALLMSIYCTYKEESRSTDQNLMGWMLAILLGPFYWIYYYYAKGYCGKQY